MPVVLPKLEAALAGEQDPANRARLQLLLGKCYQWGGDLEQAIAANQAALSYDPGLVADFPEEGVSGLSAEGGLARCYYLKQDWEQVITWGLRRLARNPEANAIGALVGTARLKLGLAGRPPSDAMVLVRGAYLAVRPLERQGALLAPADVLAPRLGLSLSALADGTVRLSTSAAGGPALELTAGSLQAQLDGQPAVLPVAPEVVDGQLLVPLRFVAETFGHRVDWESTPRIAWSR